MPLSNEHAARQADPSGFVKLRRGELKGAPAGISVIFGIKGDGASEVQSIRAEAASMTADAFRSWLADHEFKSEIEEVAEELQDEDEDEDEEEARAEAERKAKAKAKGGTGRGMGNPASRRYYADMVWGAPVVVLAHADANSTWVEIVRSGTFYSSTGPDPRRVEFSEADIETLASNWSLTSSERWFTGGAPVGYNHASAFGERAAESTKAAARIREVDTRRNDSGGLSLWALFDWTLEGAERIRAGEFAAVSAELLPPSVATSKLTGEPLGGWTLVGATLTNTPFVPGMTAPAAPGMVAASDPQVMHLTEYDPTESPMHDAKNPLLVALADSLGACEADLLTEIQRLKTDAAKVATLSEALDTATTDLADLRSRNESLEDREKSRVLDHACVQGRIAPTERDDYWALLLARGEERANALFSEGRLPVTRDSEDASPEPGEIDPDARFLSLMDEHIAKGASEDAAWDAAKLALGSTIYPVPAES